MKSELFLLALLPMSASVPADIASAWAERPVKAESCGALLSEDGYNKAVITLSTWQDGVPVVSAKVCDKNSRCNVVVSTTDTGKMKAIWLSPDHLVIQTDGMGAPRGEYFYSDRQHFPVVEIDRKTNSVRPELQGKPTINYVKGNCGVAPPVKTE